MMRAIACLLAAWWAAGALPAAAARAASPEKPAAERVLELAGELAAADPAAIERADDELERLAFHAGRPGAEAERRAVAQALLESLRGERPPAVKVRLLEHLARAGRAEAVADAGKLLSDAAQPPEVREAARRALAANPSPNAKRELRKALGTAAGTLKIGILSALGERRDFLAAADLMAAAEDADVDVRLAAVEALAAIGEISAVPAVEGALTELEGANRARALAAYFRLAEALVANDERGMARRIYGRAAELGPAARAAALIGLARADLQSEVERIRAALADPDRVVRGAAREAAALLSGPAMTRALEAELKAAKDGAGRLQLLEVLARRADREAGEALWRAAAAETDPAARAGGLRLLGQRAAGGEPPRELAALLLAEAEKKAGAPAEAAMEVLAFLPGPEITKTLAAELSRAAPERQPMLARILGARRDPEAMEALLGALAGPGLEARVAALEALGRLGHPAAAPRVLAALRAAEAAEREAAARTLVRLEKPAAGEDPVAAAALAALDGAAGPVRAALFQVLAARSDAALRQRLFTLFQTALGDADAAVRLAAVEGLSRLGDPAALAVLIERAEKADGAERAAAVGGCLRFAEALARSEPERARGIYRQALGAAREEEEKRTALRGLAEVGAPEDLDAIRPLFGAPGLRREAGRAAVSLAARLPPERKAEAAALYRRVLELDVDERTAAQCVRRLRRLGIEVDPAADAGFVTHWWILAPLPNPGGALWEKELSVEKTPAGALDLASEMNLEGRTYGWKHYQTPDPRGLVDMDEAGYGGSERGAYLYAEVTLSREAEALLKIGSDDQVACWLDGAKVHANRSSRGLAPDQDTVPVKLAAGKHRLLLKVLNDGGGWGACLRLAGPDGKPLAFEQRTGP